MVILSKHAMLTQGHSAGLSIQGGRIMLMLTACALLLSTPGLGAALPASIHVDAGVSLGSVSPLLCGNNIAALENAHGVWRKEPPGLDMFFSLMLKDLGIRIMRFPGGGHAERYHWYNAIGPRDQRRENHATWGSTRDSDFGTDEFMSFCKSIGCSEVMITTNYTTGSAQEAANWVEYCNIPVPAAPDPDWKVDSYRGDAKAPQGYFAWLRGRSGHPEPYRVKYWEIGNEIYLMQPPVNADDYAKGVAEFARQMKAVDPTIRIGAQIASDDNGKWASRVLRIAGNDIDFLCPHYYSTLYQLPVAMTFYSGGTHAKKVTVDEAGEYTFAINARGRSFAGESARMDLGIDGKVVHTFNVGNLQFREHNYTTRLTEGEHSVSLAFTNDISVPGLIGRDLFVAGMAIRRNGVSKEVWYPDGDDLRLLAADRVKISRYIQAIKKNMGEIQPGRSISIAVTEGRMMCRYPEDVKGDEQMDHVLSLKAGLWAASLINCLAREHVDIYNYWAFQNCLIGPKGGRPGHATPMYHVLQLYSRYLGDTLVKTDTRSLVFSVPALAPTDTGEDTLPYLDVIATVDKARRSLRLFVVNWHKTSDFATQVSIAGFNAGWTYRATVLNTEDKLGADAGNESDPNNVCTRTREGSVAGSSLAFTFPAHSLSVIEVGSGL